MTKSCYFNQENSLFLVIWSVIFTGKRFVALKKSQLVGVKMTMQTWETDKVTADA